VTATFRVSHVPPNAILQIEGELDVTSRAPLAWRLIDLDQSSCTTVHLDVGEVTHVDSTGMRLIDDARKRLVARGATFQVTSASLVFTMVARMRGYRALVAAAQDHSAILDRVPELTPSAAGTLESRHRARG